jgi:hypothetical protein
MEQRGQDPKDAREGKKSYQILLDLQPECLEFHRSQGARPMALSTLKVNMMVPEIYMLYRFLSLVSLHGCLKALVNLPCLQHTNPNKD